MNVRQGLHGANRLGGNSLVGLTCIWKTCWGTRCKVCYRYNDPFGTIDPKEVDDLVTVALEPVDRTEGENPYKIQQDLQETMQDLAGISRSEAGLKEAD